MASLDDILTATKNVVTALNNDGQIYLNVAGAQIKPAITAANVVKSSAGRIANVVVIVGGSATGMVYDANATGVTTNPVYVIPTTPGVYVVNMPLSIGLVVAPGTGQTVTVSYS
jgi:hypothetical protein